MNSPNARYMYPKSAALGLSFVCPSPGNEYPGFDEDEVKAKLGDSRFANLMKTVKSVFSCGHRIKNGAEAHAIYAYDLESFLNGGG